MTESTKPRRPMCHMTPMEWTFAEDNPGEQVVFWECRHCGHTVEVERSYSEGM